MCYREEPRDSSALCPHLKVPGGDFWFLCCHSVVCVYCRSVSQLQVHNAAAFSKTTIACAKQGTVLQEVPLHFGLKEFKKELVVSHSFQVLLSNVVTFILKNYFLKIVLSFNENAFMYVYLGCLIVKDQWM